jgi:tetratricopeptide (TPR) repeat protein
MSQIAFYCGWYEENANGPFTQKNVEFLPGAFAYHLHSYSAAELRSPTNHWVGPLLAKGATCTMGCVDEPYLSCTPDVAVFCARFILQGFSFGEAAYASQNALSWQITIIGDPLYRPFAKPAPELHQELERQHSKMLEWSFLRLVNLNLVQGHRPNELAIFLEELPITKQSAVLTEKLADLYAAQGKPSSALETYEKALKLDPSPLQARRIQQNLTGISKH